MAGVLEEFFSAGQEAGDVGADSDDVLADRLEVVHVVKGGGATHVGGRRAGEFGHLGDALIAEVAVLLLGQVKQRQHGRAGSGVEGDQFFGALAQIVTKMAHRSTSPMIGSIEEMTVMASETDPPRIMKGTA